MKKSQLRVGDRLRFVRPICYAVTAGGVQQEPLAISKSKNILRARLLNPSDVSFQVTEISSGSFTLRAEGFLAGKIQDITMRWCHQLEFADTPLAEKPPSPMQELLELGIQYQSLRKQITDTVQKIKVTS